MFEIPERVFCEVQLLCCYKFWFPIHILPEFWTVNKKCFCMSANSVTTAATLVWNIITNYWLVNKQHQAFCQTQPVFNDYLYTMFQSFDHHHVVFFNGSTAPWGPRPRHFSRLHFRHTTVSRTPLYEWPARRRDLYLTTHNTHNRQTSMPPGGIRTHNPSKRAVAGIGHHQMYNAET
jgi:hypothetical protein